MSRERRRTGAMLAGGAALAFLLLRGFGLRGRSGTKDRQPRRVRLRVDANGISASGAPSTIQHVVDVARRVGAAEVFATGAARQGTLDELVRALRSAGVDVWMTRGGHA